MKSDTESLKPYLSQFLEARGIEINRKKKPPVFRCPSPNHEDNNPSAILYATRVYCPICEESWDIFSVCGMIDGIDDFKKQLDEVQRTVGTMPMEKTKEKKKTNKKKAVHLPIEKAREIYKREDIEAIAKKMDWGNFVEAWPYKDADGNVAIVDVRFERDNGKKSVVSFWFDGKQLKMAGCPLSIYNLNRVSKESKPILIVEGAKSAKAAEVLTDFIPVTWNGGSNKARYVNWNALKGRDVYIYPDDDNKKDKNGKPYVWHQQPGMSAAIDIQRKLPQAVIVKPLAEARTIKEDGADIVEALQVENPEELSKYIRESKPIEKPSKELDKEKNDFPFRILGTSDDNRAYFIGLNGRLHDTPLSKISKGDLYLLAKLDWWREIFGFGGRMDWEDAISTVAEIASRIDFDPAILRGRGAWREKDGSICYHDGKNTIGDANEKRLYLRKTQRDIGLGDKHAPIEIRREISDIVFKMSFETPADAARLMAWAAIGPFAGALPWRPCGMITGSSGSGKTTVIDMFVRPMAMPETFSGGDSTEAGVRQRIKNDSACIVIEEAETDTKKKRERREDLFSLMRQSTSDDAPRIAKGTRDGKGMSFSMKSMFLFAAISPEVEHIADDNRIFRVNMVKPKGDWAPIRDALKEKIKDGVCRSIRAFTWDKLKSIIVLAERMVPLVQDLTYKSSRYALAESILFAAYFVIWRGLEDMTNKDISRRMLKFYEYQPPDESYDETSDIVDRILNERIQVEHPRRENVTIREILLACHSGVCGWMDERLLNTDELLYFKNESMRRGIKVLNDGSGNIAIANNNHEIMKIIERKRGYHRILHRHKNLIEKSKQVAFYEGKTFRSVIIGGLLGNSK